MFAGSLDDTDVLREMIAGSDAVIHAAGVTRACSAREFERINADATRRLAPLCAAASGSPELLLLSSLAARHPELSDYAGSKQRAEAAVMAQEGLRWTIIRPPAVYGPGDTATLLIFRLMKQGLLPVPPDRAARVSLIYVEDLCAAIEALLPEPIGRKSILEVRDGRAEGYDWGQIAAAASRCLGRRVRCVSVPKSLLLLAGHIAVAKCRIGGEAPRISPGKVRELCHIDWVCRDNPIAAESGWTPKVGIDEGFRRTLDWYRDHNWL